MPRLPSPLAFSGLLKPAFRLTSPLAAALASAACPVWADSVDEGAERPAIVVTGERTAYHSDEADALRTPTPLRDTPQSVAVLTRQQLDDQGVQTLNAALRYVPGVTLGQGEGHRDQVVLRGQASTADFFLDGLRDDAQYYRPLFNTERVEVLKGANALLFGRGGGGGVVNRVSKVPRLGKRTLSADMVLNSFGAWSLGLDGQAPLNQAVALRLTATREELANSRNGFDGKFTGLAPTLTARLGTATTLTLGYEYDRDRRVTDRGVPALNGTPITGYARTFFGSPAINQSQVDAHLGRARLESELAPGLTLTLSGLFATYAKAYANLLPAGASATTVTLSGYDSTARRDNWIGQASLTWTGEALGLKHTVLAGADGNWQHSEATRRNVLFGPGSSLTATVPLAQTLTLPALTWSGLVSSSTTRTSALSLYLQDQIEIAPALQLIAGLRGDRFVIAARNRLNAVQTRAGETHWSPRFGLVVKPHETLSLYASYARSFLPQAGDQFSTLDPSFQSLEAEAFRNLEAGVKWDVTPALAFTAALFRLDRSNTRVADPANPGFWLQTGASRVEGAELALAGTLARGWQIALGATWQQGTIRSATSAAPAGRKLDKLPALQASAWTRYDLTGRLGLGLGIVHQASQFASISNAVRLPGFTRVDAALFWDVNDRIALQLNVENVADTRYFASAHTDNNVQPGEPRSARISARIKF